MLSRVRPASLFIADPALGDALGRVRTSEPVSLFEQSFQRTFQETLWDSSTASGGTLTHDANLVSMLLNTTTANGSSVIFQSRKRPRYVPGKSQLVLMTGNLKAGVTNVRRRVGLFDEANGPFFEQDGASFYVALRSSVSGSIVDTKVEKASWNLDPLDGAGPSGLTLDLSKQQIFLIDFQWLGSGRVRFGFVIDGAIVYCHEMLHANILTAPYSQNGSLPIRAEQVNLAALSGTPAPLQFTCISVQSEAGFGFNGMLRSYSTLGTSRSINSSFATALPIMAIRKATSFVKLGVELVSAQVFASTTDDLLCTLVVNPTLTGGNWVAASTIIEANISATAISGGTNLGQFYLRGNSGTESSVLFDELQTSLESLLGSSIANASDVLALKVQSVSGAANAFAAMTWKEFQ